MLTQLLPVLGVIGGALIGGLTAYAAGAVKSKADLRIAERQAKTQVAIAETQMRVQLEVADGQRLTQIAIDRDRQRREKIEQSYGHLMEWLHDIESTMDGIYSGLFSEDEDDMVKCMRTVDDWPFETLRSPRYTAATRYLWSDDVEQLLSTFRRTSVDFSNAAEKAYHLHLPLHVMERCVDAELAARRQERRQRANPGASAEAKRDVFRERNRLYDCLADVRRQVRSEMLADLDD